MWSPIGRIITLKKIYNKEYLQCLTSGPLNSGLSLPFTTSTAFLFEGRSGQIYLLYVLKKARCRDKHKSLLYLP